MGQKPDKLTVDDAAWLRAMSREKIIRPLDLLPRLSAAHVGRACRELKLGQKRFYKLLSQYRASPVTSSLLDATPGPSKGRMLLPPDIEEIIQAAIRDTYRRRERPSITALHDRIRQVCHERGVRSPSWTAIRARVGCIDPQMLVRWREGAKAAKDKFGIVVEEYNAEYAFQIVQIDHTLVDLFIVDTASRVPLQRPWLTLPINIASRMVASFWSARRHSPRQWSGISWQGPCQGCSRAWDRADVSTCCAAALRWAYRAADRNHDGRCASSAGLHLEQHRQARFVRSAETCRNDTG